MKKILVISGHPHLEDGSLANKTIIEKLKKHSNVEIRDIKKMYPNFAIDVASEQKALIESDIVVFQFPLYWYSVPGIMKEWIDQVLIYGFAYGEGGDKLKGKKYVLSVTTGGDANAYSKAGAKGHTVEELLTHVNESLRFCSMTKLDVVITYEMSPMPSRGISKNDVLKNADMAADKLAKLLLS